MGPSPAASVDALVESSALLPKYGPVVDSVSAEEKLAAAAARPVPATPAAGPAAGGGRAGTSGTDQASVDAEARRIEEQSLGRPASRPATRPAPPEPRAGDRPGKPTATAPAGDGGASGAFMDVAVQAATAFGRELARGLFGTRRRRR